MKKVKKTIGSALMISGMILAVCTADGSKYEIGLRLAGVAMLAIGAWLAKAYDFQKEGGKA